jgi:hypothetical protein
MLYIDYILKELEITGLREFLSKQRLRFKEVACIHGIELSFNMAHIYVVELDLINYELVHHYKVKQV